MHIHAKQIYEALLDFDPVLCCDADDTFNFAQIRFSEGEFRPNHLYIVPVSRLPEGFERPPAPLYLVCMRDADIPLVYKESSGIKMITVAGESDLLAVYNQLSAILESATLDAASIHVVMDAAIGGELPGLVEAISRLLHKSVALLDPNLKLLACCECENDAGPAWKSMMQYGYHPNYNAPFQLRSSSVSCLSNRELSLVSENMYVCGEVFIPVVLNKASHASDGYLYYYEPGKFFSPNTMKLFDLLCSSVAWNMRRFSVAAHSVDAMFSSLLEGILSGAISDNVAVTQFLNQIGFKPRRYYAFIAVHPRVIGADGIVSRFKNYDQVFASIWEGSQSILYNNALVLLISGDSDMLLEEARLRTLNSRLEEFDCAAGISDVFTQVDIHLRNYYCRASAAAEMARVIHNPPKRYMQFMEIMLNYLIKYGISSTARLIVNPRLFVLMDFDREHATEYLLTLRYFWMCNRNTQAVCRLMHIHRNTLFYRLKRIHQIMQIDIQSASNILDLQISLALLERSGDIAFLSMPIGDIRASGSVADEK